MLQKYNRPNDCRTATKPGGKRFLLSLLATPLIAALLFNLSTPPTSAEAAQICAAPGSSGPASISSFVNGYYPGRASVGAGATYLPVGSIDPRGITTPVAAGDLLVVIQIQDAAINDSNSASYGGSASGQGYTFLNSAGSYEYVTAAGPVSAGSIPITSGLINSYTSASASSFQGQRSFQVIRVPQFSSATLTGTVYAPPWNGATGGVVALDVAGSLNWNSQSIDVSARGFRGGAAQQSNSNGTGDTLTNIDYVSRTGSGTLGITAVGTVPDAAKGEGIAGTPIIVYVPATPNNDIAAGSVLNTGGTDGSSGGYPGGSFSRGAPGNAGGGGTDGNPAANDQNSGGGGGGNYGPGGNGGFGWITSAPPGAQTGGYGGGSVPDSPARLFFGGGGGAGTTNDGTGGGFGIKSSGAAGGGVVLVRAGSVSGTGVINANGGNGNFAANPITNTPGTGIINDASGGGGAGGSVLVFINNGGASTGATINVNGGRGGNNAPGAGVNPHGPGGGGSGGYAVLSGSATVNYAGGANGITNTSAWTTADYGSTTSPGGYTMVNLGPASIPGVSPSPTCYPRITVSKTTATPNVNQGGTISYSITASNLSGYGTAGAVTISDTLPSSPNFSYAATTSVVLAGGATRTAATNPTAGATAPSWGSFSIPGGGSVTVTFTVNVALATPLAIYQNPASVSYGDPTATSAGQTVTPGGAYAGGGTVLGSNYDPSSSTGEDVTVRSPASFAKSFNPTSISVGGTTVLTVVVSNPTPINFTNAGFSDSYPAGMVNAATPAASTTCAGGTVTAAAGGTSFSLSGATVPTGGSCQVQVTVTAPVSGPFTNTIASGALTDNENITDVVAGPATLQARPTITKAFSPIAVPQGTPSLLTFTISNPNASALSGLAFTDSYPTGLFNTGPAITTGGTCPGFTLDTFTKGGGNVFNVTGGTIPAAGSCTITVTVQSATAGNYPNTTSGVNTTLNPTLLLAGPASNTAALGVGTIAIAKSFSTSPISIGGTSTVTLTLANPTGVAQTGGSFADPLANMSISANQTVGGTCTGVTPSTLTAGQTALSFSGINIPAAGCTMSYVVTSSQAGSNPNTTTGVSTALLPVGPPSNTAQLVVIQKPTIAKAFVSPYFQPGGSSSLVFTIANPNSVPLTGISFSDSYPANLTNSTPLSIGGSCSGVTVSGTTFGGGSVFNVSGGSVPALSSCTVSVQVTSSVVGTYNNTASGVASVESGSAGLASNTATLNVVTPPAITAKSFTPALISQSGISTVSFTLQNNNPIALSNLNFSDALTNMTVANGSIGGSCLRASNSPALVAGATALNLTVPTLAAGASCTVTAQVTSSVSGANPNQTSGATATESPVAGSPSPIAKLNVLYPPLLAKSFVPGQINAGGSTTLTFNVSNPNSAALTNVHFTDPMTSMTLASTSFSKTCSGVVSFSPALAVGATQVNPTLTSLNANESCTISVTVTSVTISPAAGLPNTTSGATSTETPLAGAGASTALDVLGPAGISKSFSAATMQAGGSSTITFLLSNPNATALTGASFSDSFPAGMTTTLLAQTYTGGVRGTCTGTIPNSKTTTTGDASVSFAGINIPALGSCTVLVDVTAATAGSYINTVSGVTSTQVPTAGATASATLNVLAAPVIVKRFSPSTIAAGDDSTLTLTITNPNATALSGVAASDTYPANLVNLNTTVTNSCNGTATASASTTNPGTLKLTGGTLAANASCTISVSVTSTTTGSYVNTTGGVTSTQTPAAGTAAMDTLTVVASGANRVVYTETFSQPQVQAGPVAAAALNLIFTISNLSTGTAATDVHFTSADAMPAGGGQMTLVSAANSCTITAAEPAASCGYNSVTTIGTVVANSANSTTSLNFGTTGTGLRLAANSTCTVTCPVTIPAASTGGSYSNTATALLATGGFTATSGDTATVLALKAPGISQAFSPATVGAGSISTLTFTLSNSANPVALSNASFSDTLANLSVAGDQSAGGTCGGVNTNSLSDGQTALSFSGLTLPASGTCTVTLKVTSSTLGANANTPSGVSTTQTPTAGTAATSANLTVVGTTLTKAFAPTTVRTGQSSTLTFTITNGTGKPAQSGLAFTETFPSNVVVANPANSSTTCGAGTVSGGSGSGTVALSNGSMLLNQTNCLVQIDVTSASAGSYNNLPANVAGSSTGMTNSVNATLTVYNNAIMTKAFTPAIIGMNGTSTLTFTISNGTSAPLQSGLGFTDTYPVGVLNTGAAATSVGCGTPTITAAGTTGLITVSAVQVAAAPASCTISVPVTAAAAGSYPNTSAGNITGLTGGLTANGLSSTLSVVGTTLSKAFAPATVQIGSNSVLTLTITNGAGNPAQSALSFTDTLPAGLVIANPNGLVNGCGGTVTATAGTGVITLPAGSLAAAAASCTISVNTVAAAAGTYTNSSANISAASGNLDASAANATVNYLAPAGILKSFSPAIIAPGGTSIMTFTISNTNSIPLTGASFSDTLVNISSGIAQVATGSCGGVGSNNFTLGQTGLLSFSNLTIQPGGCTVSLSVTSSLPGNQYNTASGVTTAQTSIGSASNSAQLTVTSLPPATSKAFGLAAIPAGGTTTLVLTLSNPVANPGALTTVLVDDGFPAGLVLQNTVFSFAPLTCGSVSKTTGAASAPGDNNARFSVASLASGATCQVTLNVTSSTAGPITNTTSAPSAAGPTAVSGAAASAVLNVLAQPLISVLKSANVASANPGQVITYTVQIVNSGAGAGSNVVLTDDMSRYGSFSMVTPFSFVDSSPVSGLTLGVPQYSVNNGTSWAYALVSGAGGAPANYDGAVTNWRIPMTGTIRAGGSCIVNYKIMVK